MVFVKVKIGWKRRLPCFKDISNPNIRVPNVPEDLPSSGFLNNINQVDHPPSRGGGLTGRKGSQLGASLKYHKNKTTNKLALNLINSYK